LGAFGEHLGVAFQLVDDVLDYAGEETGKTMLADLAEGKLTLPLVLAVQRQPDLAALVGRIHAGDREPIERVGRAVVESGACDEVRQRARKFTGLAVEQLADLKPSPARQLLVEVARQLAQRAQ
jgi:octaprenyl-diphosphate synthase